MNDDFIRVQGERFTVNGSDFIMRGFGVGSWMNLEHFMIGIPGSEHLIKKTFREVLGPSEADRFFDSFLRCFLAEEDFAYLKSLGVNTIRVPVNYRYFLDDQNPNRLKDDGFRYLDAVVRLCEKYRIYLIPDLHAVPGGQNPDWHSDNGTGASLFWHYGCFRKQAVRIWKHIASHYSGNPWVGGYDLLNEPFFIPDGAMLDRFYREAIEEIRSVDKDHVIFLEGGHFAMDFSMLSPPDDPNVAFEFHYYPTVWNPDAMDSKMPEEKRQKIFQATFDKQLAIREKFHRPVWCGELGCTFDKDCMDFTAGMDKSMIDLCEANGVSWTLWAYKDAQVMGLVSPLDDTPWMKFVKKIKPQWNQEKENAAAQNVIRFMGQNDFRPVSEDLNYVIQFRFRAVFQVLYCEQILKPALEGLSTDERKTLPESFLLRNCKPAVQIEKLVRSYTARG